MAPTFNSPTGQILPVLDTVTLERDGHVLLIGLNRPHKRNAFDRAMLADLSRAYAVLESDTSVRAGVLFAHGDHLTAGLDLAADIRIAVTELFASEDAAEGVQSFIERRDAHFQGR